MAQEDVLIKFEVDYTELDNAISALEKTGKLDPKIAASFSQTKAALVSTATDTKGLITEFKNVATTATRMGKSVENAFGQGVQNALDNAGVSVDEFAAALKKADAPVKRLKTEMLELKEAIARMKAEGKDTGAEFDKLVARAGRLSDAIGDANKEIKNAGSDTRGLDNVVGSISALAGGFSAIQGAAALFGDENKDLQKTLVKVTGAMALAQGIQQFYNATLKEGSLTKLADSVATGVQTAATTLYTFVVGGATVATKVFRAALIATGIGAIVVLVLSLVSAMNSYGGATSTAAEEQQKLADATAALNQALSDEIDFLNDVSDLNILRAKNAGASLATITALERKALTDRIALRTKEIDNAIANGLAIKEIADAQGKDITALQKFDLEQQIKAKEDAVKNAKDRAAKLKAARLAALQDELAELERRLILVDKNTQEEVNIRKRIVDKKADIELQGEKITAAKINLIQEQSLKEQYDLQQSFNEKMSDAKLNALISTNKAILSGIIEDDKERMDLEIENLQALSQLEINAAIGNAAKILEINARTLQQIRDLKNKAINQALADELAATERARNRALKALRSQSDDTKKTLTERLDALNAATEIELNIVDKKIRANELLKQSDADYNKNLRLLSEEVIDIKEAQAEKEKAIRKDVNNAEREEMYRTAGIIIDIASQVGGLFEAIAKMQTDADNAKIAARRKEVEDQLKAGAITEKAAIARQKQLDILQKQASRRAAQREKDAAVFSAVLAIPKAFLQGLTGPGGNIYLAAIYAALAALEAGIIASKPIPQFFRGKTGNYEGPGVVADMGSEIVERKGRMYLYTKPTQTYLGATDKVYTASQTRAMLHNTDTRRMQIQQGSSEKFDYAKFGAAIPKNSININIDKDFISESVANGLQTVNYKDRRYSSK